ncbi:hypothetical protein HanIR_Chr04g0181921 [Helianthus annuus]|nr:hypothetical protein HanIR_Chr04g0181921 [Helianthus annuus]
MWLTLPNGMGRREGFWLVIECRESKIFLVLFLFIYNPIRYDLFRTFHQINYLFGYSMPF